MDTSLPRDIRDPTSALQTFRSRRDGVIPLKRPHRVDPSSSSPSESHEASSQRVDTPVSNFCEKARARVYQVWRASLDNRYYLPQSSLVTGRLQRDLQGESLTLIRPFLIPFADRKSSATIESVTFCENSASVNVEHSMLHIDGSFECNIIECFISNKMVLFTNSLCVNKLFDLYIMCLKNIN